MNKKKSWLKGCTALVIAALMATSGTAALPVSAATTSPASAVSANAVTASFSASSAYKINLNQGFGTSVSVSGGKASYTYKFGYKKDGVTTYVSTETSAVPHHMYSYKFTETGSYVPIVEITDANNTKVVKQLSTVTVKDFKAGFYQTSSNKILVSQGFSTAVSLSGGRGIYSYRYGYILNGKTTYFGTSTSGSPEAYYTYKFPAAGIYTPIVEVTDADGVKATNKLVDVIVKDFTVNFGKVAANFVNVNCGFSTTASVDGGKAPYTFKYRYKVNGKTTTAATLKTSAPYLFYTYQFPVDGSYTPMIEVTDADGVRTTGSLDAVTVKDFKANISKLSAPYVNVNTGFSTATSANGGNGTYTYRFGYTVNGESHYTDTKTTDAPYVYYTYKFPEAGSYIPYVDVADGDGVRTHSVLAEPITVKDFKASFSKISAPYVNVNTGFSTGTSVSGGRGTYTYKFGYTVNGTTKYITTQTTGSPYVYYTYKFPEAGTYTPFVEVADADGVRTKTVLSEPVTVKDLQVSFTKASSDPSTYQDLTTYVNIKGGKSKYQYRFGYTLNGKDTYVSNSTSGAPYMTYVYHFTQDGTYTPFVEVADGDGVRTKVVFSESIPVKYVPKYTPECTVTRQVSTRFDDKFHPVQLLDKDNRLFTLGTDYLILSYSKLNNEGQYDSCTAYQFREAGKYKVKIQWRGRYTGEKEYDLEVKPCNISTNPSEITWSDVTGTWDNTYKAIKKDLTVKVTNAESNNTLYLVENKDYTVTYNFNTAKKTYTATVKGKGNFEGTLTTASVPYTTEKITLTNQNTRVEFDENEGVLNTKNGKITAGYRVYYIADNGQRYLLRRTKDYFYAPVYAGNFIVDIDGTDRYKMSICGSGSFQGSVSFEYHYLDASSVDFIWGKDNIGFTNTGALDNQIRNNPTALDNACTLLEKCGILSKSDLETTKDKIVDANQDHSGGFCGGMAKITILRQLGILHDVQAANGEIIRADDYLKECSVFAWHCYSKVSKLGTTLYTGTVSDTEKFSRLENTLKEKKPVEIVYEAVPGEKGMICHAVSAYGFENCSFYCKQTGMTYTHRILLCDPNGSAANHLSDDKCLYYNDDGSWTIPCWSVYSNNTNDHNARITNLIKFN